MDIWRNLSRHQFIGRTEELHLAGDYADMDEWAEDTQGMGENAGGLSNHRYRPGPPKAMREFQHKDRQGFDGQGTWMN